MNFQIVIRSLLVGFLVAIPAPFLIAWLTSNTAINPEVVIFISVFTLALLASLIMGMWGIAATTKPARRESRSDRTAASTQNRKAAPSGDVETGTVKWFNRSKGFGFITRSSGEDVFVHYRSIVGDGRRTLNEGQRVRFVVVTSDKGLQAEEVSCE